jgi:hypothetical protein
MPASPHGLFMRSLASSLALCLPSAGPTGLLLSPASRLDRARQCTWRCLPGLQRSPLLRRCRVPVGLANVEASRRAISATATGQAVVRLTRGKILRVRTCCDEIGCAVRSQILVGTRGCEAKLELGGNCLPCRTARACVALCGPPIKCNARTSECSRCQRLTLLSGF